MDADDELARLRPSFTADATNEETFNDSNPPEDWEKRHEEMARLLEQEHQKFAVRGDMMDDADDDDLLADDIPNQGQEGGGSSFFGFNTSLEHLRGANLNDDEEVLARVSRLGLADSNGARQGQPDSYNDQTFGDDALGDEEGETAAWAGLGKDGDDEDDDGAVNGQAHGGDAKRVSGILSLEEIEASLARANPAGAPAGGHRAPGGLMPGPGADPRFAGAGGPGLLPPQAYFGMPQQHQHQQQPHQHQHQQQQPSGPGGRPSAWLPLSQPPGHHQGLPMKPPVMGPAGVGARPHAGMMPHQQQQQHHHQQQHHQHHQQQQAGPGQGYYGNQSFRAPSQYEEQPRFGMKQRWTEHRDRMSAFDINTIIRLHSAHLPMPLPFNEDYYYQSFLFTKSQGKRQVAPHTPLCETQPLPVKKLPDGVDPFKGALGRIPNHSVRSPRPLLQLEAFLDQRTLARRNRQEETKRQRQQDGQETGRQAGEDEHAPASEWSNNHAVLLRIEQAFGLALDLEDIDLLLANAAVDPQSGMGLLNKRRDIAAVLFGLLNVNTQPPMAPQHVPTFDYDDPDREAVFSLPEDELLVRAAQVPKGCRLLARAVPLLSPAQAVYLVYAFVRNLHYIVTLPKTADEMMTSARMCFALAQTISGLQLAPLTVCLHMLIAYAQIEAFKAKSGLLLLRAILTRAFQLTSQLRAAPPQHGTAEMAELSMWEDTLAGFMEAMSGYCCALLRLAADEDDQLAANAAAAAAEAAAADADGSAATPPPAPEGSIFVGLVHVWDFLLLLTLHMSPAHKEAVFAEVREPLEETLMNPSRAAQHKAAIAAFLQRVQKDHLYASVLHMMAGGGPPAHLHPGGPPSSHFPHQLPPHHHHPLQQQHQQLHPGGAPQMMMPPGFPAGGGPPGMMMMGPPGGGMMMAPPASALPSFAGLASAP